MPKPLKQSTTRKANWTTAEVAIKENSDQETLEKALLESKAKLHNAQQQIASLESALSDNVANCSEHSISL